MVKKPLPTQETEETWVRSPGQEDPLEAGMAAHSSVLAWRIPWTEEPGGLQKWGHTESDTMEAGSSSPLSPPSHQRAEPVPHAVWFHGYETPQKRNAETARKLVAARWSGEGRGVVIA